MTTARDSYEPQYFEQLAQVEDQHFWFRARNQLIHSMAKKLAAGFPEGYSALETGCGNGNVLRWLESACPGGRVVGLDLFPEGLALAKKRTECPLVAADVYRLPFGPQFHLVGIFDVLEHLEDDGAVLQSLKSVMHPDGVLMITVPAGRKLWSYFDVAARHCRRYEPEDLRDKLEKVGLSVEFLSPFMSATLPMVYAHRKLAGWRTAPAELVATSDLKIVPGLNEILTRVLQREGRMVAAGRTLRFGSSLLAIARRS